MDYRPKNKSQDLETLNGILQVSQKVRPHHPFQLLTETDIINLEVPIELTKLFKRHVWERLLIKGVRSVNGRFRVKLAFLENEGDPSDFDLNEINDLDSYKTKIKRELHFEPLLSEIA